jgi:hypothetical protein
MNIQAHHKALIFTASLWTFIAILALAFLLYEPNQANKPGGADPTVVWWSVGKDVPCKHKP